MRPADERHPHRDRRPRRPDPDRRRPRPAGRRMNFVRFRARAGTRERRRDGRAAPRWGRDATRASSDSDAPARTSRISSTRRRAEGQPPQGNVQTAVTLPVRQGVQDAAGQRRPAAPGRGEDRGRVLTGDPAGAALWSRQGLSIPVARPIWMAVAALAISLFTTDVAVRRCADRAACDRRGRTRAFSRQRAAGASNRLAQNPQNAPQDGSAAALTCAGTEGGGSG